MIENVERVTTIVKTSVTKLSSPLPGITDFVKLYFVLDVSFFGCLQELSFISCVIKYYCVLVN